MSSSPIASTGASAPLRPIVSLIAAMAHHRVIGRGNRLPWSLPADLSHFKRLTLDKPIIMGRRTWESLPHRLERRHHIVVTGCPTYRAPGCIIVSSPREALAAAAGTPEVMVIGGASLYRAMLPRAQYMYLTEIDADIAGDVFFPNWERAEWREVDRRERQRDQHNPYDLAFVTLARVGPAAPGLTLDGCAAAINDKDAQRGLAQQDRAPAFS